MAKTPAKRTKPEAPRMEEFAASSGGRDVTRGFIPDGLIYPTDRVLQARGSDYKIYEMVLSDDQVQATFQQRRNAVTSREWEVLPGGTSALDKKAADFLEEQLDNVRIDAVTEKMLYGAYYGYAVAECMWAIDGSVIALDKIKVRKQRRFRYDNELRLRLLTADKPDGEIMPERKFWHFATGGDNDDDPYGIGLAHWLFWPVTFKRNGIKFWLTFLEKFGMPTAAGKYPKGATPGEKKKLLAAAASIAQDTAIIMPEDMTLELIEAARSGTSDYAALHDRMNAAISKVVVGQTMTTDDGSSQSQANVHMDVRQDIVKADADLVCESFNMGPARWLTEWNFPGAEPPTLWRRVEDEPDLASMATRDKTIHDMGFKPTLKYINETYGGEWTERKSAPNPFLSPLSGGAGNDSLAGAGGNDTIDGGRGGGAFAEGTRRADAIDRLTARAIGESGWQRAMDPAIDPIRQALAEAPSLTAFRERLDSLQLGTEDLAELLAKALFAVRIAGETEAPIADDQD